LSIGAVVNLGLTPPGYCNAAPVRVFPVSCVD
jgi:hypothetical protein